MIKYLKNIRNNCHGMVVALVLIGRVLETAMPQDAYLGVLRGVQMSLRMNTLVAIVAAGLASVAPTASFASVTFTGLSGNLSAEALFSISGNNLTITLTNTATVAPNDPTNTLTGLFFSFNGSNPTLTPVSATIPVGSSIVQPDKCDVSTTCATDTNVGGEFIFDTGPFSGGGAPSAEFGIASAGYISGSSGNFGGPNLDDPAAPDGINFGIVPSSFTAGAANGGLDKDPLIRNSVVFVLSGVSGFLESAISGVSFQYGTAFGEPNVPSSSTSSSTSSGPPQGAPEPGTSALALLGAALIAGALRQRRKTRAA